METTEALSIMQRLGVIVEGHFLLRSGRCAKTYVNKDALSMYPPDLSQICRGIAEQVVDDRIDVVAAPAVGGIALAQWVAYHLTELTGRSVIAVYAEKETPGGDAFVFRRGFDEVIAGKRVFCIEDILTTGGSAKKIGDAVRNCGGSVVGLGCVCNRGNVSAEAVCVPKLVSVLTARDLEVVADLTTWESNDCPQCAQGIPYSTSLGHASKQTASNKTA